MKRRWVPIDKIDIWDQMHHPDENGGFVVDAEKDGMTTEEHIAGIEYIKGILKEGQKVRPILVADTDDGHFERLDGFKRTMAHKQLGHKYIEAFVCSPEDYRERREIPCGDSFIRCDHGGLPKENFALFENGATEAFDYDKVLFLFKSPQGDGLRIELDECVHVHWGQFGKNRLTLGGKDFTALAEAVSQL